MKVIILAAGDNEDLKLPSCFNLTVGAITLLEYHTRILRLLGFNEKDIFIIKNQKDMDLNLKFINLINIEKNNKKSFLSLKYFIDCCRDLEDLLIINGNSFFELKDLEKLINNPEESKVLIEKRNSLYTKGIELILENNKLVAVSDQIPKIIPWLSYYGAMFLTRVDVLKVKNFNKVINEPYLNVMVNNIGINLEKVDVNIQNNNTKTLELVGGSFAGLNKINIVKKYANIEGNDKLIMEIEWLKNLPQDLKGKFPIVLDYQITPEESWFSMPFYEFENLRKKIISGKFSISKTSYFIEKILNYLFEKIYINNLSIASSDWVEKKHFDRFYTRLEKIKNIQPFNEILLNKYII
ncbi:hypothetical protein L1524_001435, partial [Campylobacter jejuni]|nr:hypothetical protein [Campylobacter jejuni]